MEKSKVGMCTTCNMTEGSTCTKWCAGCTLHKLLRIMIMVVALCAAYSFGEQVGMIKSMIMNGDSFMPHHNMMYRNDWDREESMMMGDQTAPTMMVAPATTTTTAPIKTTTTKQVKN